MKTSDSRKPYYRVRHERDDRAFQEILGLLKQAESLDFQYFARCYQENDPCFLILFCIGMYVQKHSHANDCSGVTNVDVGGYTCATS